MPAGSNKINFRAAILKGRISMIMLTKLNGIGFMVNSDLIKYVEVTPDTVLYMTTGEKIIVKEPLEVVRERVIEYKRSIYQKEDIEQKE